MRRAGSFGGAARGKLFALGVLLALQSFVSIWQAPTTFAAPGSVVINEIQPATGSAQKFIELYNRGPDVVDISGWRFSRGSTNLSPVISATAPLELGPGQFYTYITSSSLPLASGAESPLRLLDRQGIEQDSKVYSVTAGNSVMRFPDGEEVWREARPTIGQPNTVPILPAPFLLTPEPQAVMNKKTVQFRWSPVVGATSYRLQIARTNDFSMPIEYPALTETQWISTNESLDDGVYFWRIMAEANYIDSTWSASRQFVIDTVAPELTVSPMPTTTLNGTKTITATASDANPQSVVITVSPGCGVAQPGESLPASASINLITPTGAYRSDCQVTATAVDAAGNRTETAYGYIIDNNAPELVWSSNQDEAITSDSVLRGQFKDESGIRQYTISLQSADGTSIGTSKTVEDTAEFSFSVREFARGLPNGSYRFSLQATDRLGNQTTQTIREFTLFNALAAMDVNIVSSSPTASSNTFLTLSGQTVGSVLVTAVRVLEATDRSLVAEPQVTNGQWAYRIAAPSSGRYAYLVQWIDENGNTSETSMPLAVTIAPFLTPPSAVLDQSMTLPLTQPSMFRAVATPVTFPSAFLQNGSQSPTDQLTTNSAIAPVLDTTSRDDNSVMVASTPDGWKIFGVAWYWWLLLLVFIAAGVYYLYRRARQVTVKPDHTLK